MKGLGFKVWRVVFCDSGPGFRATIQGAGDRMWVVGGRIPGSRSRAPDFGCRIFVRDHVTGVRV